MKFLHVSTGDVRGAFSGAYRLHRNLIASGHDSRMLVADRQTEDPAVIAPSSRRQAIGRQLVRAMNQFLKLVCGRERQVAHHISFNFGLVPVPRLVVSLGGWRPDLIIVHYTSGFISPAGLAELKATLGAPMALYLLDMEMLTGACHYAWSCRGYIDHCASCPVPRPAFVKSWIAWQWRRRKASMDTIRPVVVAGSGWLARQAAESAITRALPRRQVLLGIDPQLYVPADKPALRQKFGLPPQSTVLYFGAQNLDDPRKGFKYLDAALRELAQILDGVEREGVVLFTVGRLDTSRLGELPFRHVHQPYIAEPRLFAGTYAAADLFICPSVEDSGPMMINEAIMSGTPVAAFEMGVAVDLVIDGATGYRVPLASSQALARALATFVRLPPEQRTAMSRACRSLAVERTSAEAQARAFVELASGRDI